MYTFELPILYPEACSAENLPRSAPDPLSCLVVFRSRDAVRSLMRWLYLHRRLRSRQRGPLSFDVSDWAPFRMINPSGVIRFYPDNSVGLSFDLSQAFRLRLRASWTAAFRSFLSSNGVSPPPFHLPVPVKLPVSNLDCETSLHPFFSKSSRKYFNYCPLFTGILWKNLWISFGLACG